MSRPEINTVLCRLNLYHLTGHIPCVLFLLKIVEWLWLMAKTIFFASLVFRQQCIRRWLQDCRSDDLVFVSCYAQLPCPFSLRACHRSVWPVCVSPQQAWEGRGKAATFVCLFVQPGVVAGLQGICWRPWVPGPFGRSSDRSIASGYTASPCFQNRSEGGKRTCADFFAVCLYIDYHPRSWERASQEAPFGLWEPVSHTKEPCLKTNSLDFGLCWGFPTLF